MTQSCESFARTVLVDCPDDVQQRLASGLGVILSPFNSNCGAFNYQALISHEDPTARLPVLFDSKLYRSPNIIPTNVPMPPSTDAVWFGLSIFNWFAPPNAPMPDGTLRTWCCKTKPSSNPFIAKAYCYNADPAFAAVGWIETPLFHSTNDIVVMPFSTYIVEYPENRIISNDGVSHDVMISDDGSTVYKMDTSGVWSRSRANVWTELSYLEPYSTLSVSVDGSNFCAHRNYVGTTNSRVFYSIGSNTGSVTVSNAGLPYAAILGSMVFIAQGSSRQIETLGSLGVLRSIKTLENVCRGLWSDGAAVYVGDGNNTLISNNAGWSWVQQLNKVAVSAGIYLDPSNRMMWQTAKTTFKEEVGFPLRLSNSGLLHRSTWKNWFEFTDRDERFTLIDEETTVAVSPNERYLVTIGDDDVKLFLNVWKLPSLWLWCQNEGENACMVAYRKYCQLVGIAPNACSPLVLPDPKPDNPPPPKPKSIWLWVGLIVGGLVVGAIVLYVVSHRSKPT
jgi:hypothetical protein